MIEVDIWLSTYTLFDFFRSHRRHIISSAMQISSIFVSVCVSYSNKCCGLFTLIWLNDYQMCLIVSSCVIFVLIWLCVCCCFVYFHYFCICAGLWRHGQRRGKWQKNCWVKKRWFGKFYIDMPDNSVSWSFDYESNDIPCSTYYLLDEWLAVLPQ